MRDTIKIPTGEFLALVKPRRNLKRRYAITTMLSWNQKPVTPINEASYYQKRDKKRPL